MTTAPPTDARFSRAASGEAHHAAAGAADAAPGDPATRGKAADASFAALPAADAPAADAPAADAPAADPPTVSAQATATSPNAGVGVRPEPDNGDRPDKRAGDRFNARGGDHPDAPTGDHPDRHGGNRAAEQDGDRFDARGGNSPDARTDDHPDRHSGNRAAEQDDDSLHARGSSRSDAHAGDRVDKRDADRTGARDGSRSEAHDADRADARDSDRPDARDGDRIAKWLARAGVASRRDAERLIGDGKVSLNGRKVTHPATFVASGDIVQVAGQVVDAPDRARLWRYHKPDGLMTTHKDPEGRPTVFDKMPAGMPRVVSVGRLDLNSEGLLLLTNDGALARQLELPANGWIRRYRVRVHGAIEPRALADLARGLIIDGVRYAGIEAGLDSRKGTNAWLTVSLKEGRNREIRRVMQHLQLSVTRLIRIAYGPFQLGNMERGEVSEVPPKVLREQLPQAK